MWWVEGVMCEEHNLVTLEFSGTTFLVLISGSVVTSLFHHSILFTCGVVSGQMGGGGVVMMK